MFFASNSIFIELKRQEFFLILKASFSSSVITNYGRSETSRHLEGWFIKIKDTTGFYNFL